MARITFLGKVFDMHPGAVPLLEEFLRRLWASEVSQLPTPAWIHSGVTYSGLSISYYLTIEFMKGYLIDIVGDTDNAIIQLSNPSSPNFRPVTGKLGPDGQCDLSYLISEVTKHLGNYKESVGYWRGDRIVFAKHNS